MSTPRIVSLVPGATAWLAALGAADLLVGGTAACAERSGRSDLPVVTRSGWQPAPSRALVAGDPASRVVAADLDESLLDSLVPDLVIVNSWDEAWDRSPAGGHEVVDWSARTYRDVLEFVLRIGRRVGRMPDAMRGLGDREAELRAWRGRIGIHRRAPDERLLRTVVLTSLDPPVLAAGWMNELVDRAALVLSGPDSGEPATRTDWDAVAGRDPAIVLVALPGAGLPEMVEAVRGHGAPVLVPGPGRRVACLDPAGRLDEPGPGLHETIVDLAAFAWRLDGRETRDRVCELTS